MKIFSNNVLWTDEVQFDRDAGVNLHNVYSSVGNPRWLRECRHQWQWSVKLWCVIFRGRINGPYFFEENMTGKRYTECTLKEVVTHFTSELPLSVVRSVWYQHDGAPLHLSSRAVRFLGANFSLQ